MGAVGQRGDLCFHVVGGGGGGVEEEAGSSHSESVMRLQTLCPV